MASSCAFCFLASLITRNGFVDRCSRYTCVIFLSLVRFGSVAAVCWSFVVGSTAMLCLFYVRCQVKNMCEVFTVFMPSILA